MSDIKYEIIQKIGMLSKSGSGWEKQLNLVSWNDRDPKYDIREWAPDGVKMGKHRRLVAPIQPMAAGDRLG